MAARLAALLLGVLVGAPASAAPCLTVFDNLADFLVDPPCDEGVVMPTLLAEQLTLAEGQLRDANATCANRLQLADGVCKGKLGLCRADVDAATSEAATNRELLAACEADIRTCTPSTDDDDVLWGAIGGVVGAAVTAGVVLLSFELAGQL